MIFKFSVYSFIEQALVLLYNMCFSLSCKYKFLICIVFLQELPIEIYGPNRKIPETGIAMYGFGKEVVHGSFKVKEGGRIIKFKNNWSEFRAVARLHEKSIMFAAIHFAEHWISINIIKIITNTLKLFPNE